MAASHTVQTAAGYIARLRDTARVVAANQYYRQHTHDEGVTVGDINVNDAVSAKMRANQEKLREMDFNKYMVQLKARDKKKQFSGKRSINDDIKYEFFNLVIEASEWGIEKSWEFSPLESFLTAKFPRHRTNQELILRILDYGLHCGSDSAEVLEENLLAVTNALAVDPDCEFEVNRPLCIFVHPNRPTQIYTIYSLLIHPNTP